MVYKNDLKRTGGTSRISSVGRAHDSQNNMCSTDVSCGRGFDPHIRCVYCYITSVCISLYYNDVHTKFLIHNFFFLKSCTKRACEIVQSCVTKSYHSSHHKLTWRLATVGINLNFLWFRQSIIKLCFLSSLRCLLDKRRQ